MIFIDVFKYFIGSTFFEGLHVVPILLLANIFLGIVFNLSIWYKLANRTKLGMYIIGFGAVVTLVINMIFVPMYGYVACAWATLICYFLMSVLSYILCQKYYSIPYNLKSISFYFGLALFLVILHSYIHINYLVLAYCVKFILVSLFVISIVWNEKIKFFKK
jgi:O-antigen/teichoic acid export membrane protein